MLRNLLKFNNLLEFMVLGESLIERGQKWVRIFLVSILHATEDLLHNLSHETH